MRQVVNCQLKTSSGAMDKWEVEEVEKVENEVEEESKEEENEKEEE